MNLGTSTKAIASAARVCALLGAFAGAGCGGGGGTPAASAPPNTSPPATTPPPTPPPITSPPSTAPNRDPIITKTIPNQTARGGRWFEFDASQGGTSFTDPDGDPLTYYLAPYELGVFPVGPVLKATLPPNGVVNVRVLVQDGRNGAAEQYFQIQIIPNAAPEPTRPNLAVMTEAGARIDYDATKSGTTFTDADGDPMTYVLRLVSGSRGLSLSGTRVIGTLTEVGVVTFELTATDDLAAQGTDRFSIAVAAPEPPAPVLPSTSYVYADAELSLPDMFATTHLNPPGQFWDPGHRANPATNAGATLGRVLFYDKRLSITNTHACGSCHHQENGFGDPRPFPVGVQQRPVKRHAMALSNARFNFGERWFMDLRVGSLEELALMPIQDPMELGNYTPVLEEKLAATTFYPPLFEAAFGTREITSERIALALAQFLRSLTSYRSRYDQAYTGQPYRIDLLTAQELRGQEIFRGAAGIRCALCHNGHIQSMRTVFGNGLDVVSADGGLIGSGGPTDWFRTASLRNIAASAPYMHDGRFATLREVIDHYDHGIQLSDALDSELRVERSGPAKQMNLSEEDKLALEAFLRTLTDEAFLTDPKFADPFP